MDIEWAKLIVTLLTAAAGAAWAIYRWTDERRRDREVEQKRIDALYVIPFLFACEDLQSRLYNILCEGGLTPLRKRPGYRYAEETIYLVAQYFAYEPFILRYTMHGTDPHVLGCIQRIRADLATDEGGTDPWCIFRPRQQALGRLALVSQGSAQESLPDTISLLDFEKRLDAGATKTLHLQDAIATLKRAESVAGIPLRTRSRLATFQSNLVDVLAHFEQKLAKGRNEGSSSLFMNGPRRCALNQPCRARWDAVSPALSAGAGTTAQTAANTGPARTRESSGADQGRGAAQPGS